MNDLYSARALKNLSPGTAKVVCLTHRALIIYIRRCFKSLAIRYHSVCADEQPFAIARPFNKLRNTNTALSDCAGYLDGGKAGIKFRGSIRAPIEEFFGEK